MGAGLRVSFRVLGYTLNPKPRVSEEVLNREFHGFGFLGSLKLLGSLRYLNPRVHSLEFRL